MTHEVDNFLTSKEVTDSSFHSPLCIDFVFISCFQGTRTTDDWSTLLQNNHVTKFRKSFGGNKITIIAAREITFGPENSNNSIQIT